MGGEEWGRGLVILRKKKSFSDEANSFLIDKIPVQKGIGVRESKQKVTKVSLLFEILENQPSVLSALFCVLQYILKNLKKK